VRLLIRTVLVATTLLCMSGLVFAEPYTISGSVAYQNDTPVQYEEVEIDCATYEYDCHAFEGQSEPTDHSGGYELTIEVDESYDGAELLLTIRGESFSHVINLSAADQTSEGYVIEQDIILVQNSPTGPIFTGLGCSVLVFSVAFILILIRTVRRFSVEGEGERFVGRKTNPITDCPVCEGRLPRYLLTRHLIVEHEIDAHEAAEMVGSMLHEQSRD